MDGKHAAEDTLRSVGRPSQEGVREPPNLAPLPKRRRSILNMSFFRKKNDDSGRKLSVSGDLSYSHLPNTSAVHKRLAAAPSVQDENLLWLASLPKELHDVLIRYDTNGDGLLDQRETELAAADLIRMRHIV
mmetsp:Transcript_10923/g.21175  ORF Transcript_10923/g.21175 Transcript_10923/m.21175 type:complete len:132 (+) Transcript_10923:71-466(+)